ncbi:hypothetical protein [Gemmatimonas aurantiaca]|uniref:hypothetical protein n=1 Tax=Gemmatimonas aurantiaca TaxID=173480 RepID=UPI00301C8C8D
MHSRVHSLPAARALAASLLTAALLFPARVLPAQAVAGAGDDAIPLSRGGFRYLVSGLWNDYDQVFSPNASGGGARRGPLLGALAMESAGVGLLPRLAEAQNQLRTLTGENGYAMSLGRLDASGEVRQSIAPIGLEYGATRRLSFRVLVPYAESRDVTQLLLNRVGTGANVGLNPALLGSTAATSAASNTTLVGQLDQARSALSAEITRCADTMATECDAIRANPQAAQTLVTRTQTVRDAVVTVYGTTASRGAPFVPLTGSAAQTNVAGTLGGLRTDFAKYGITSIAEGAQPSAATRVLGPGGMPFIGTDSSMGVGYERLGNTRRAGIGDIDLTASFLLYDTFGADQARRLQAATRGVRTMVSGGWRFGTAGADRTEDAFDVPIGEGANAVLVRSTTDLVWSRRLWMSATVRAAKPMSDHMAVVLPYRTIETTFANPVEVGDAVRTLGMRTDIEVAPRISFGDFFGVSGAYIMRRWGEDHYDTGNSFESRPLMAEFTVPSRTLQAAAVGVTFSTLASYARRRSRIAAEVMYTHTVPISASGGVVPAVMTDRLELRVYTGFPRR